MFVHYVKIINVCTLCVKCLYAYCLYTVKDF